MLKPVEKCCAWLSPLLLLMLFLLPLLLPSVGQVAMEIEIPGILSDGCGTDMPQERPIKSPMTHVTRMSHCHMLAWHTSGGFREGWGGVGGGGGAH